MSSLEQVIQAMQIIAPLELAEPWDNVGLLIEPPSVKSIHAVFLTIDLTEPVYAEALASGADCIIAYHPPIFSGLKRLTQATPAGRILTDAIQRGLPIYAPHTALDAVVDGMNDWLALGLGPHDECRPISPKSNDTPDVGAGRYITLTEPTPLSVLVALMKTHLQLSHIRVAAPAEMLSDKILIHTVAVCPGAGGSLLQPLNAIDLYVTGEMRHHDVLAKVATGSAVFLTDHTNSERGYLPRLKARLQRLLGDKVEIMISGRDQDPLQVY